MSNNKIGDLVRRRATLKTRVTKSKTFLNLNPDASKNELMVRLEAIDAIFNDFLNIQDSIEAKTDNLEAEEDERDEFEMQIYGLKAAYKDAIEKKGNNPTVPVQDPGKLKPLDVPKFNGQVDNWLSFSEIFNSLVNENTSLDNIKRFHYLRNSLIGKASDVLDSIPIRGDNYDVAWRALCKRYNNKKMLLNYHLKKLFEQPSMCSENFSELITLYDNSKKHIEALRALQVPIQHWDLLLIHLIRSKFSSETKTLWDTSLKNDEFPTFEQFDEFLENRCYVLSNEDSGKESLIQKKNSKNQKYVSNFSKANRGSENKNCQMCKEKHPIFKCFKFLNLNPKERYLFIKGENLCLKCFGGNHSCANCPKNFKCNFCSGEHNNLLHFEINEKNNSDKNEDISRVHNTSLGNPQVLLATALVIVSDKYGNYHKFRALLDSGSQSNFITNQAAQRLGLNFQKTSTTVNCISNSKTNANFKVTCSISSPIDTFQENIDCLVLGKITSQLPAEHIKIDNWHFLNNFTLADATFHIPGSVDLLLGAAFFEEICQPETFKPGKGFPTLRKTVFGWVIIGQINETQSSQVRSFNTSVSTENLSNQIRKFWEIEEVECIKDDLINQCEEIFKKTTKRRTNGKFVVELPFDPQKVNNKLGDSKSIARRRLLHMEKKMKSNIKFAEEYRKIMQEYIDLGHLEKVPYNKINLSPSNAYYLPHHAVVKLSSNTTKLRVVFDGSCKTGSGYSLNDLLLNGPVVQDDLFSILIRFRFYSIAFVADIEKMYRMIDIAEDHKRFQRVLWRKNIEDPIEEFASTTVTFGIKSSSFLATRVLVELSNLNKSKFPRASEILKEDCYVDNVVSGSNNLDDAFSLQKQLINILKEAGLNLRQWCSNYKSLIKHLPEVLRDTSISFVDEAESIKTLGLVWSPKKDVFSFKGHIDNNKITKRSLTSEAAKIFDPLGLVSPVSIKAKIMIQTLWTLKIDWDDEISPELQKQWSSFRSDLNIFEELKIDRNISLQGAKCRYSLHAFSDASQQAYAATIYIVARSPEQIICNLLCSKTKVAPLKVITIPRLELCAAQLAVKLTSVLIKILRISVEEFYFWSDSQIVLHWIATPPRELKTYVSNRVSEIQEKLAPIDHKWKYVRSKDNPADIASRGTSMADLINNKLLVEKMQSRNAYINV